MYKIIQSEKKLRVYNIMKVTNTAVLTKNLHSADFHLFNSDIDLVFLANRGIARILYRFSDEKYVGWSQRIETFFGYLSSLGHIFIIYGAMFSYRRCIDSTRKPYNEAPDSSTPTTGAISQYGNVSIFRMSPASFRLPCS